MSSNSNLPAVRPNNLPASQQSEGRQITAPSRAITVERGEIAGVTIGHFVGREIKKPIAGLALIIAEQLKPEQLRIREDMAVIHPSGTLVVEPARNDSEALKAAMYEGIQQVRGKMGEYLVKKAGYGTPEHVDREIERVMREAVAEAAEWLKNPNAMVSKVQIERAKNAARAEFPNLPLIASDGQSGGMISR
jgi:hypothetical protein